MAYARLGDCDVYVFLSFDGHLECCMCSLERYYQTKTIAGMVEHLRAHKEAGHDVPDRVFEAIREDAESIEAHIAEKHPKH